MRASSAPPRATSKRMTACVARLAQQVLQDDLRARPEARGSRPAARSARPGAAAPSARDRALEQAAVARDLDDRAALPEPQLVGARVGRVEEAQPVDPALDAHPRRDGAVDEDRVAAEAEVDVLRVAERAVLVERVVGDHERHVVLAARQLELLLALVAEQVGAEQPVVERLRRAPVGVVVVPEERRVLVVRVRVVERAARAR